MSILKESEAMSEKVELELENGKGVTFKAGSDSADRIIIEGVQLTADDVTKLGELVKSGQTLTVTIKQKG